jgi:biuret amidohydrolase
MMEQMLENAIEETRAPLGPTSAIIAVHWQYDVVAPGGALSRTFAKSVGERGVVAKSAKLFDYARRAGAHIVYVIVQKELRNTPHIANNSLWNLMKRTDQFFEGTRGVEILDELAPSPQDVVIHHDRISCFYGTSLLSYLVGTHIKDVYLTGVATNVAVDHTAKDAVQYGFNTYLIEDCCAAADMKMHDAALMTLRVLCTGIVTSEEILKEG